MLKISACYGKFPLFMLKLLDYMAFIFSLEYGYERICTGYFEPSQKFPKVDQKRTRNLNYESSKICYKLQSSVMTCMNM